jgi:transcriptional regulator with XRE-family HTH domain
MAEQMTGAEIAAARHLIGLSQAELAEALSVGRHAVKDWESGRFTARPGVVTELRALLDTHTAEVDRLQVAAADGVPIHLPRGPRPPGWYLALGARVLDRDPGAMLEWQDAEGAGDPERPSMPVAAWVREDE